MEDPLWRCMDSSRSFGREQLELVIQKKKIGEIHNWFQEHFVKSSHAEYISRCPIIIIQGPTGCGKTSTLKWISKEFKLSLQEYSETTDITAINYDLQKAFSDEERNNLSNSIDRRRASKFEHFVVNSIRYNTLYPTNDCSPDSADSEFDSDDGFSEMVSAKKPTPVVSGVIIHIDTPLTFSRSQRILIQSLYKLLKIIKEISRHLKRRVAIVFESLEGESETLTLPTKMKLSLGIQMFKFNPITRANMKKLVESLMRNYKHIILDKETIEQLVNDCDGDMRACINTLQLICNRSASSNLHKGINNISLDRYLAENVTLSPLQANKKQKLHHEKVKQVRLNPSLMRDNARSLGFFHVLGKIFYQKRLYPCLDSSAKQLKAHGQMDRPFLTENSTEFLANMLCVDPKNLFTWLHQHYYKFCGPMNIEKAALFLDNLTIVDTISLNSTQSSQFYEAHNTLDQLQTHLAIESTVFSLYENQSNTTRPSHKKISTPMGVRIAKSSVENFSSNGSGELYSFNKPLTMSLPKLVEDYQWLLDCCATRLIETNSGSMDPTKILVDYIPYISHMSKNISAISPNKRAGYFQPNASESLLQRDDITKLSTTLDRIEEKPELDFEIRHEKLLEMIEEFEVKQDRTQIYTV